MIDKENPDTKRELYLSNSGFRLETVLAYNKVSVFSLKAELAYRHGINCGRLLLFASSVPFGTLMYALDIANLTIVTSEVWS
jgi:hypothetical protein